MRDPDSATGGDDKTLHDQEERRLFYVAMTRAKDSLHIYGKQGMRTRQDAARIHARTHRQSWIATVAEARAAMPSQPELIEIAAAADSGYPEGSRLPAWLELPAIEGLGARLSASAVETYETCPLQFKFEREWKLSRQVHAAMQYGAAMHRVLRTYYDSARLGRTKSDDELMQLFRDDEGISGIQDDYQRDLYLKQGAAQLQDFLAGTRSSPAPEVLHTEEWFDVEIAGTKVAGRIDRDGPRTDGSVNIVDYKTGKARSQEDADESLQLSIYAMAASAKSGDTAWALWCFTISKATFRLSPGARNFNWRRRETASWPWPAASRKGTSSLSLITTAISARSADCVRRGKSGSKPCQEFRLVSTRQSSAQKLRGRFPRPLLSTSY